MILVRFSGGLGNQMFQYAFGKALSLKLGVPLRLDISLLGENASVEKLVVRHFDLDLFCLPESFASKEEIERFNGKKQPGIMDRIKYRINKAINRFPLVVQQGQKYDISQVAGIGRDACLVGRWQSEIFFKGFEDDIRKVFSFADFAPNLYSQKIFSEIKKGVSVAVHIRRGDYVTHPEYAKQIGALNAEYYQEAIALIKAKLPDSGSVKYFFISDDPDWCKSTFASFDDAVFVEQEKNKLGYFSDLWLLTRCDHCIMSNSTFSWWGAWLGEKQGRFVIAPERWARNPEYVPEKIIPSRWIKLKNSFEEIK